jgi:colanic acid/amylovoran biosynthesis glycosyltransferase
MRSEAGAGEARCEAEAIRARGPGIAHFRRVWFLPTESFLHHLVTGCRRTRPLLVGYERDGEGSFPVACPTLALYPRGTLAARWLGVQTRWLGRDPHAAWDTARLLRALRAHRTRVLHAHFGPTGYRVLPVQRRAGLPLVVSFYGHDVSAPVREPRWRTRYAELFARADRVLAEGPCLREALAALGCPREKISLQPIAIPVARYPFRERGRREGEPVRILFCARLTEKKGARTLLEALARVRADHPGLPLRLRLAGDGPERAETLAAVERLGLAGAVEVLGAIPHSEFVKELEAADLFAQPSVTASDGDTEGGAPTTLLEAQACGVPILATRHADIPHVVVEGESALLAPERDPEALAAHLERLLARPERWPAMGRAGRAHVEAHHDTRTQADRLEYLYVELAGAAA